MGSESIVLPGLGTLVQLKSIGGGAATIVSIQEAQALIVAAQVDKASQEITKQVKQEQKAVLEARQAEITTSKEGWQAIIDNVESSPEAVDEAESQIDDLEDEETENDTTITAIETEITALDADIAAAQTIIDTQTTTIETLESVANAGVYTTVPNVEEVEVPQIKHVMDSFIPIDNSSNGYPIQKPTGAKENGKFAITVVHNGFDPTHLQLRQAAELATRLDFRYIFTDGMTCQFYAYVDFEPIIAADKLNRAEYNIMVDGRILWN